jgi:dTDP-4-dehydrorhamnose reductase
MKVAILGDGLLARSINEVRPEWPMVPHSDFDIRHYDSIVAVLRDLRPDLVVNTVALHSLDACERQAELAFDVNARGADRVASLVPTVYVSTDYVWGGGGPHDEAMPGRQPMSVYGRSKLAGELATLERDGIVVRVAALYGHYPSHKGPTFPDRVLSEWGPLDLPTDQRFSPTYAPHAAIRIAHLVETEGSSGIYHATGAGSATWLEFATEVLKVARRRRKVTGHARHDPLRPTDSSLRSTRLPSLPHWRLALDDWWVERNRRLRAEQTISPLRENAE